MEAVQSVTGIGTCQTADLVRNVGGGALALLAALCFLALAAGLRAVSEPDRQP